MEKEPALIRLNYLYRDYSNYKRYGSIILSNPAGRSLEEIEMRLRSKLLDGVWFLPEKWNLPTLHFECGDLEDDHPYHELESVEMLNGVEESILSIEVLLSAPWND